jgi:signal transduction histidine kinase/ActR/RegA family two-component response regulator
MNPLPDRYGPAAAHPGAGCSRSGPFPGPLLSLDALALERSFVAGLPDPALAVSAEGRVLYLNPAAEVMLGLRAGEACGLPWTEAMERLAPETDVGGLLAAASTHAAGASARIATNPPGARRQVHLWRAWAVDVPGQPAPPVLLYAQDVTDQAHLERAARDAERLVMAGKMAAGLAHELKNPLSAIQGFGEYIEGVVADETGREHLRLLVAQARRAEHLVNELLGFATPSAHSRAPVDINDVVHATVSLLRYQLRRARVEVVVALQDGLPPVTGHAHELQQVLVNLIVNAQQALASAGGGRVTLTSALAGDHVQIAVADDGPGISDAVLPHVFEPFVSTKPEGMGTGLGLSICAGIVEQHSGHLAARNRPEGGAEFTVRLPVSAAATSQHREPPVEGGRRILVVDDDEAIRALLCAVLTDEGFEVAAAVDGREALQHLDGEDADAVICDVNMPGMGGREFYEALRGTHPELAGRMVFTTGAAVGDPSSEFARESGNSVLSKPFSLRDLIAAVASVTHAAPSAAAA